MKIGYQGDLFSNSEEAAHLFAKKRNLKGAIFVPLISSKNVALALQEKEIDLGVMAIKNKIAGDVIETKQVLSKDIKQIDSLNLPIHHCLFKKTGSCDFAYVASHIQALNQTKLFRKQFFPDLKEIEAEDTALAAHQLSTGVLPENYAVICRKNAGLFYGLSLIQENIEDDKYNETLFGLFQLQAK